MAAFRVGKVLDDDDFSDDLSDLFNTPTAAAPDLVVSSASASDTTRMAGQAIIWGMLRYKTNGRVDFFDGD